MTPHLTRSRFILSMCSLALTAAVTLHAQTPDSDAKPTAETKPGDSRRNVAARPDDWIVKTYYLQNTVQQNDANEVLVALRNMLQPTVKIFLVTSGNAIVVDAPPDQHRLAVSLIHDLDRPKQSYKLIYTLTEVDAGKRVGTQHFTLLAVTGQRTTSKEGSKIPVLTGSYTAAGSSNAQQQFQYLDVGINFDATLDAYAGGVRLRSKVEQSSSTEDKSICGVSEPVIRQAVIEGTAILVPGKPVTLGSLDVPGTTRRIDVDVVAELQP